MHAQVPPTATTTVSQGSLRVKGRGKGHESLGSLHGNEAGHGSGCLGVNIQSGKSGKGSKDGSVKGSGNARESGNARGSENARESGNGVRAEKESGNARRNGVRSVESEKESGAAVPDQQQTDTQQLCVHSQQQNHEQVCVHSHQQEQQQQQQQQQEQQNDELHQIARNGSSTLMESKPATADDPMRLPGERECV